MNSFLKVIGPTLAEVKPVEQLIEVRRGVKDKLPPVNIIPKRYSDIELLIFHRNLHQAYERFLEGEVVRGYSREDFMNVHEIIRKELEKRNIEHREVAKLDFEAREFFKMLTIQPSGEVQGKEIFLQDYLREWTDDWILKSCFVILVGEIIEKGGTNSWIEILCEDFYDLTKEFKHILTWRLARALPQEWRDRLWVSFGCRTLPPKTDFRKTIKLGDLLNYWNEDFRLRQPYVWVVGGIVIHGKTVGDVDILINEREEQDCELRLRVENAIDKFKTLERITFHYDLEDCESFFGPFTDNIPLYALTLRRKRVEEEPEYGKQALWSLFLERINKDNLIEIM